ncbi:hypothetical protein O3G_MSEX013652 [Manduca sexta]|uniref:Uncharacterized protein n=1 Tax=Manduca sexta TaxID=7130 RepID=A0A921ZSG8_MANSE|nr:hypothetical protein O3G_MSEX013652 [Manduca sexta]
MYNKTKNERTLNPFCLQNISSYQITADSSFYFTLSTLTPSSTQKTNYACYSAIYANRLTIFHKLTNTSKGLSVSLARLYDDRVKNTPQDVF